jgi:phosphatidylserine/phosphatidylglycerophosphate/cardiolipin synthase-like enzyme
MWFADPMRSPGTWDRKAVPLPASGNTVEAYVDVIDYYVALGREIRATRPNLADSIYIAGWGLDLDTFVDPPGATPRETLGTLLTRAASSKVEIRVILPDQPKEGQDLSLKRIAALGGGGVLDPFHKAVGTHHQKFVLIRNAGGVVAFCGGCDIGNERLGRDGVAAGGTPKDEGQKSAPWHDVQVKLRGPAVADIWNSFIQRYSTVSAAYAAPAAVLPFDFAANLATGAITAYPPFVLREPDAAAANAPGPGLEVQVVRTYPNKNKKHLGDDFIRPPRQPGYSFASNGEMGVYRLLVHALSQTRRTIYLEDQYLVNTVAMASNPPITDAIKRAIEQPSFQKMIIAVAGTPTVRGELFQAASRRADFIKQLGPAAAGKVETYVYRGDRNSPNWFHSKLWIFDDEFTVIGSANCNRRGYSYDSELGVGIADPDRRTGGTHFAHRLRMNLWIKHLSARPESEGVGVRTKLGDQDVRDFVAASALWPKAPLLQKVDFTSSLEPDTPAKTRIEAQYPLAAKFYGAVSNRDVDWMFIDPTGA